LFFWQEFEIRTKPDCLKNSTETGDIDANFINDKLSGSFHSVNTSSLSLNDPTREYKEFRHRVKTYISIFRDHILDLDHPINKISKVFVNTFSNHIEDELRDLHKMKKSVSDSFKNMAEHRVNQIIKQLQSFILKLQTALRLMYSKTISYTCFVEEKDEFVNLITNLIFREDKIYTKISKIYQFLLFEKLLILENNFKDLKDITPDTLGLNEKYCLNDITRRYQQKLSKEYYEKRGLVKQK